MDLINAFVYDPLEYRFSKPSDKARVTLTLCEKSDTCILLNTTGTCLMFYRSCPNGKQTRMEGYTTRARKFREWITANRVKYAKYLGKVKSADTSRIVSVGTHMYVPQADIIPTMYGKDTFGAVSFLPVSDWTVENIANAGLNASKVHGRWSERYIKRSLTPFLKQVREATRGTDVFEKVCELYPRARELVRTTDVGRKALLRTLTPNVGEFRTSSATTDSWTWDGTYLHGHMNGLLTIAKGAARVTPDPETYVTITDDGQVNDTTIFKD